MERCGPEVKKIIKGFCQGPETVINILNTGGRPLLKHICILDSRIEEVEKVCMLIGERFWEITFENFLEIMLLNGMK